MIESRWKIILEPNIKHSNYNKIFSLYRIEYKRGTSVLLWVVNSTFRIMDNCSFQALHTGHEVTNMAQYAYVLMNMRGEGNSCFSWWLMGFLGTMPYVNVWPEPETSALSQHPFLHSPWRWQHDQISQVLKS